MSTNAMAEKIEREMEETENLVKWTKKFIEYKDKFEKSKELEYKELENKENTNDFSKILEKIKKLENLQISIDK